MTLATKRNPELEAAILSNPDAADAYLVYGDWLLEQGDPRGEFVAVQAQRTKKPKDAALKKRERALLSAHEAEWLGPFAEADHTWAFGFLESFTLSDPTRERYRALLVLGAVRFLRELYVEISRYDDPSNE